MTYQTASRTPLPQDYLLMTLSFIEEYHQLLTLHTDLQHDLDALQNWVSSCKMDFNPSKPITYKHKLVLHSWYHTQSLVIGQTLEAANSAKYLGVIIDSKYYR